MLEFIYYPVSFILWCWHKVFGFVFGDDVIISWILAIFFLTFTIRGIMFKPFVKQVRSMRKMQEFAPEMKKIQKKYGNDRQRQAAEMQKLQREHGVNPLGSCLPMLLQIPVFIGLNWVLRNFTESHIQTGNYFFSGDEVRSYLDAKIFGINLGDAINHGMAVVGGGGSGGQESGWHWEVAPIAIPLMIIAAIATHFTARHSVARQNPASATQQTAMMNKLTLYVFPIGVLVFGAFFPIGLLLYWLANNSWTLMQQAIVYKRIDREEETKKIEAQEKRNSMAPKPGQKPRPGQKPSQAKKGPSGQQASTNKGSGGKSTEKASESSGTKSADKSGDKADSKANDEPASDSGGSSGSKAKSNGSKGSSGSSAAKNGNKNSGQNSGRSGSKKTGRKRS
ncbi:YidC/Oxa1 family membrane protein insertase [Tamaricihabitans halophyticus]|uniref:Membrane protein insertase YidC n=1 Tax=Tamaricihabitans halophyticus TaxID=1262583 RepID=A0A4R2R6G8_9PSEU|nr:membrane protein insertase YidC [Tamaricihabitans halophyticus]TCP57438.1 YidC/Oxa1 family membrane protein insertase [Tamaricihabitans halophyticus]